MRLAIEQQGLTQAVTALLGASDRLRKQWATDAYRVGTKAVSYATRTFRRAAETSLTATAVRSARLWRSYTHEVTETARSVNLAIGIFGSRVERGVLAYAGIHEYGGVVRPRNVQYLTIPLAAAKTARGVARGTARDFAETFVARARSGKLILFQRQGKAAVPLFLLTKGPITIPARPSLKPTMDVVAVPEMEKAVSESFGRALEGR